MRNSAIGVASDAGAGRRSPLTRESGYAGSHGLRLAACGLRNLPIFAAVIALANAARLAAGLPVLGFVNPALYAIAVSTPGAFHDITAGNNSCTES